MFLLSIITVVYNGEADIEKTITSVVNQNADSVEYIIIDGGSTDSTLKVIDRFKDKINIVCSEPDSGVYDAMNKGIGLASGKYIYFINSGDTLREIPLNHLAAETEADMICFPVTINGSKTKYPKVNFKFRITNTLPHQGIFYKSQPSLNYDLTYKVYADYALNADFVKMKKKLKFFSVPAVANHNLDGISNNKKSSLEFFRLIKDKFGLFGVVTSFIYFKLRGVFYRLFMLCF